jgi:hypothetical protein
MLGKCLTYDRDCRSGIEQSLHLDRFKTLEAVSAPTLKNIFRIPDHDFNTATRVARV